MALLSMRDVSLGFGGHPVLEGIDLQIERGERLGLLGRNGRAVDVLKLIAVNWSRRPALLSAEGRSVAYLSGGATGDQRVGPRSLYDCNPFARWSPLTRQRRRTRG